ncbi:hypothetical protein ACQP3J_31885, partial [Escherichia coli]
MTYTFWSWYIMKGRQTGTQVGAWRQELKKSHWETLHSGLFSMADSAPLTSSFETGSHYAALAVLELCRQGR